MQKFKLTHKVVAWTITIFSQVTVAAGIYSYCNNRDIDTVLHYVDVGVFFGSLLLLEIWH